MISLVRVVIAVAFAAALVFGVREARRWAAEPELLTARQRRLRAGALLFLLAAIAIPNYIGQQDKAKDAAAMAQLRMAATSQQLYYVDQNAYAGNAKDLEAYGFRQGEQVVTVGAADASTYCMQAPGGGGADVA